ncbi:GNAT family N-acetyltransferase [Halobacillus faecis]
MYDLLEIDRNGWFTDRIACTVRRSIQTPPSKNRVERKTLFEVKCVHIDIEEVTFSEVLKLESAFTEAGLKLKNLKRTVWIGARHGRELVGVCAYRRTRYGVKCKSDLVLEPYRKRGIYHRLFQERLKRITELRADKVYAYCNKNSLPVYLKNGFMKRGRLRKYTYVESHMPDL